MTEDNQHDADDSDTPDGVFASKQGRLALLIACGDSNEIAAKKCGIGSATAWRWRRSAAFRELVHELRAALITETTGKLAQTATQAAAVLNQLLSDSNSSIKLGAARTVLERAAEFIKIADFEERLNRIEADLKAIEMGRGPS